MSDDQSPSPSPKPNPANIAINTPEILSQILRFATDQTLSTCLRVNKYFFDLAGTPLYRNLSVIKNPGILEGIEIPPLKPGEEGQKRNLKVKLFAKIKVMEVPLGKPLSEDEAVRKAFWKKIPKLNTIRFTYYSHCLRDGQTSKKSRMPKSFDDTKWPRKVVFTNITHLTAAWVVMVEKFVEHAKEVVFIIEPTFASATEAAGNFIARVAVASPLVRIVFCVLPRSSYCSESCKCNPAGPQLPRQFKLFVAHLALGCLGFKEFYFMAGNTQEWKEPENTTSWRTLALVYSTLEELLRQRQDEVYKHVEQALSGEEGVECIPDNQGFKFYQTAGYLQKNLDDEVDEALLDVWKDQQKNGSDELREMEQYLKNVSKYELLQRLALVSSLEKTLPATVMPMF